MKRQACKKSQSKISNHKNIKSKKNRNQNIENQIQYKTKSNKIIRD
jgi:hypothetical protein